VEDDEALRESTLELFEGLFKKVVSASDGKVGLGHFQKERFDIVITDIQMPNMNGIELSREIIKQNKNQKIIIVSAYNETEYFIELIKIGVSGFMQKPLTTVQMLDVLYDVCLELDEVNELLRYVDLGENFRWDSQLKSLSQKNIEVALTLNERSLLDLFLENKEQKFTDLDIYNYIYHEGIEKEFSSNAIKSLIKRLRKKIPQKTIQTHRSLGYSLKRL
jgi:two-component system response regulator VanR